MIRRESPESDAIQVEQFFIHLDYDDRGNANPISMQIGGYFERFDPKNALYRIDAAELIWKTTMGAHIVGAVPSFDTQSLENLMRTSGYYPGWHYHLVDVENLAVGYLAAMKRSSEEYAALTKEDINPPWRSEELSVLLGVELATPEEKHTALGDARWAMRMYDKIMGISDESS